MYTVVYVAQSRDIANKIKSVLLENGIDVSVGAISDKLGNDEECFEIMVLDDQVSKAHSIIIETGFLE